MATVAPERDLAPASGVGSPGLVFFHSSLSGRCRRVEGFIAQVLQRRRNHDTFRMYRVAKEQNPELFERFAIEKVPTLVVIDDNAVRARLEQPRSCRQIERFLAPWLR
jgi:thioredoxin-like negative regulator of GroEL